MLHCQCIKRKSKLFDYQNVLACCSNLTSICLEIFSARMWKLFRLTIPSSCLGLQRLFLNKNWKNDVLQHFLNIFQYTVSYISSIFIFLFKVVQNYTFFSFMNNFYSFYFLIEKYVYIYILFHM